MRLVLPYPPSTNMYWRMVHGRILLSRQARRYKKLVGELALIGREGSRYPLFSAGDPVAVEVHVYRPRKTGDLDNRLKIALDALNGILWQDDAQIVEIHAWRHEDKRNPRIEVFVRYPERRIK